MSDRRARRACRRDSTVEAAAGRGDVAHLDRLVADRGTGPSCGRQRLFRQPDGMLGGSGPPARRRAAWPCSAAAIACTRSAARIAARRARRRRQVALDEVRVEPPGGERRDGASTASSSSRLVVDARDARAAASASVEPARRASARVGAVRDHLGEHRIVVDADLAARPRRRRPSARPGSGAGSQSDEPAGRRQEVARGILGVEARLDGVAVDAQRRPARAAAARPRATSIWSAPDRGR